MYSEEASTDCFPAPVMVKFVGRVSGVAPSSSGPGYLVLIQKIAGSNPAGVTSSKITL